MAAAMALLGATPAYADFLPSDGALQLDGDVVLTCGTSFQGPNACGNPQIVDDWTSLYSCVGDVLGNCTKKPIGAPNNSASVISDYLPGLGAASTIFTGGGSKDEQDITQWAWKLGSAPDKDELVAGFSALYNPTSGVRKDHDLIYFAANRLSVSGDAQIGFWFFQDPIALCGAGGGGGSPFCRPVSQTPVSHKVGDLLILSNFQQGGGQSNIQVYAVTLVNTTSSTVPCPAGSVETSAGANAVCLKSLASQTVGSNGVCNQTQGPIPGGSACAATNGLAVTALDPAFQAKTSGAVKGTYPIVDFFEGALDLNAFPELNGKCFSTFLAETRSSQSVTATLKDFLIGSFEHCPSNVTTDIKNNADGSSVLNKSVQTGTVIYDVANALSAGVGKPVPTGTITFKLYSGNNCGVTSGTLLQTYANMACVPAADNSKCVAQTPTFTTASPPAYSYFASYSGDANYPAADDGCEVVNIQNSPTLSTTPNPSSGTVGVTLNDTGTLNGAFNPTGSITFKLFDVGDTTCSGTPVFTQAVALNGSTASTTGGYATTKTGTFRWTASWPGDANNQAASSGCTAEQVTIGPASPTLGTTPSPSSGPVGSTLNDSASLTGGYSPTGQITFKLYPPSDTQCTGTAAYTQAVTVSGGTATTSPGFAANIAGTWRWTASYSGDANNNQASSGCQAEQVTLSPASPSMTTTPSLVLSAVNNDSATLSGGFNPTGTLTFKLFKDSATCVAASQIYTQTVNVSGNGQYSTSNTGVAQETNITANTTFYWTVAYSGDANNGTASSACGTESAQINISITKPPTQLQRRPLKR